MLILLFVVIINLLLGLFVFARNPKSKVNIIFLVLVVNVCLWSISSYLTDNASSEIARLYFAKAAFVFPVLFSGSLVIFSKVFPVNSSYRMRDLLFPLIITLFGVFISITNLVVAGINLRNDGTDILPGTMYNAYTLVVVSLFAIATYNYIKAMRHSNAMQRMQAKYFALGLFISFFWALIFNAILPLVLTSFVTAKIGPLGTVFLVSMTAYAIIRHKLFDVRAIVARSIAYTLLLITIAGLYALSIFTVTKQFFAGETISGGQQLVYIMLAIFLAFTFQPLKQFFDRLTNKIFYRDAYDSQEVLNEISKVLTTKIALDDITRETLDLLGKFLKPTYARFIVMDEGRIYHAIDYREEYAQTLSAQQLEHFKKNLIIVDAIRTSSERALLSQYNISVILRLKTQEGNIGYIVLGSKQSGNIYTNQDIRLLEILQKELAVALQNSRSFEKIADFNITLQQRIEEATKRLAAQNKKLKELDQAKDEFVSMASHQLRTPLTTIKGYISMLEDGDAGKLNKQQANFTNLAYTSAQRMVFLISDMLNVSRINTGKLVFEQSQLDLAEIVKDEVKQLLRTAESRGVKIFMHPVEQKIPKLNLDEGKIRQVIMNFIDNAIYYAPNTTIEVFLEKVGDKIRFRVVDHGIGVPEKEKDNLFAKFYRAENAKLARPDGTGLGLFMAKMVVEMQGGEVIFESQEGKGSTFGFTFPEHLTHLSSKKPAIPARIKVAQ